MAYESMSTAAWILRHSDQFDGFWASKMNSLAGSPLADGISKGIHLPHHFSMDRGMSATDPTTIHMLVPVRLRNGFDAQAHSD